MPVRRYNIEPPAWSKPAPADAITVHLKTITPMFGGGYGAGEVDDLCVIRPAAIRGQLRYWWRATAGAQYTHPHALFDAEEALWGSADKPGQAAVSVQVTCNGTPTRCAEFGRRQDGRLRSLPDFVPGWPAYALQPFQGKASGDQVLEQPATARLGVVFRLVVSLASSDRTTEVRQAVAAWVRFGGIGARTRRGCGSLGGDHLPKLESLTAADEQPEELPILRGAVAVWGSQVSDPIKAWGQAVAAYRAFRQDRSGAPNRPGRSRWPEPDSVRRISGQSSAGHAPTHPVRRGFPRADLGLPIIFHFKDRGDPADATLHGPADGLDRFASPVITKAVAVHGGYRPLVLVLKAPHVWQFGDPRLSNTPISQGQISLTTEEKNNVPPLGGQDVREALVRHVEKCWSAQREVLL